MCLFPCPAPGLFRFRNSLNTAPLLPDTALPKENEISIESVLNLTNQKQEFTVQAQTDSRKLNARCGTDLATDAQRSLAGYLIHIQEVTLQVEELLTEVTQRLLCQGNDIRRRH